MDRPIDDDGCRVDVQHQTISQGRIASVTFAPWREYDGRSFVCHANISLQVPPYSLTLHSQVEAISEEAGVRISSVFSFIHFNIQIAAEADGYLMFVENNVISKVGFDGGRLKALVYPAYSSIVVLNYHYQ